MIINSRVTKNKKRIDIELFHSDHVDDLFDFVNTNISKINFKYCDNTIQILTKILSENDKLHLKTFKKIFFAECYKHYDIEKTPMSKLQKNFWISRGFGDDEANSIIKNEQKINNSKRSKESFSKLKYTSKLSRLYWINKGYSKDETDEILKNLQGRGRNFYLKQGLDEKVITDKLKKRNIKWQKSLQNSIKKDPSINKRKGKTYQQLVELYGSGKADEIVKSRVYRGGAVSNVGKNCCVDIINCLKLDESECLFGSNELIIKHQNSFYKYDFNYRKIIVEFNGDFWHMNPKIYSEDDINPLSGKVAKNIWKFDDHKKSIVEKMGYRVIVIWESDWITNKEKYLKEIKELLCLK